MQRPQHGTERAHGRELGLVAVPPAGALGPRLASFAALSEVLFALVFAWLLLDELPRRVQVPGGVLILGGVVVVRLGERRATVVSERPVA